MIHNANIEKQEQTKSLDFKDHVKARMTNEAYFNNIINWYKISEYIVQVQVQDILHY